jgi:hypothetical protein
MTNFLCEVQIHVTYPRFGFKIITATVDSVNVATHLSIDVWHQEDSPNVIPHEETHREIAEYYYQLTVPVARHLAEKLIGRKFSVATKTKVADIQDTLRTMEEEFVANYHREVGERNGVAQEYFDDVTDHGRDLIANADAKARAIAQEEAAWASKTRLSVVWRGWGGAVASSACNRRDPWALLGVRTICKTWRRKSDCTLARLANPIRVYPRNPQGKFLRTPCSRRRRRASRRR